MTAFETPSRVTQPPGNPTVVRAGAASVDFGFGGVAGLAVFTLAGFFALAAFSAFTGFAVFAGFSAFAFTGSAFFAGCAGREAGAVRDFDPKTWVVGLNNPEPGWDDWGAGSGLGWGLKDGGLLDGGTDDSFCTVCCASAFRIA